MTIVDDGSHNSHAQPSPDGRFVAFDSDRDGERGIYVANRDGSQVRRVSGAGYAAVPTWSRNNEWLAYIRAEAEFSLWDMQVRERNFSEAVLIAQKLLRDFPDNRDLVAFLASETADGSRN